MFRVKTSKLPPSREQLFDNQLATLVKLDCPLSIVEKFGRSRERVLNYASSINIANNHTPFLPIITPYHLGYYGLMELIQHNAQGGVVECEVEHISDLENVPTRLYYIFDVEDGTDFFELTPETAHILIYQQKRFPATAAEIGSIALHSNVLEHHSLYAVGSRFASDRIPIIWLNVVLPEMGQSLVYATKETEFGASLLKLELGRPGLGWWYSTSLSRGGAPSCGSRLEI